MLKRNPIGFEQMHEEGSGMETYVKLKLGPLALCILSSWQYLQIKMAGAMHCDWGIALIEVAPSLL